MTVTRVPKNIVSAGDNANVRFPISAPSNTATRRMDPRQSRSTSAADSCRTGLAMQAPQRTDDASPSLDGQPLLATRAFAALVGVIPETVRRWVRAGRVRPFGVTPTGQLRFHPDQVREVIGRPTERARDLAIHVHAAREKIRRLREARAHTRGTT